MNMVEKEKDLIGFAHKVISFRMNVIKACKAKGITPPTDEQISDYISNYGLNEEQAARMELYTNFDRQDPDQAGPGSTGTEGSENGWYDMINGKPCFEVE